MLDIAPQTIQTVRFVITKHPDWNDEDIAVEVLDLQGEGSDVEHAPEGDAKSDAKES